MHLFLENQPPFIDIFHCTDEPQALGELISSLRNKVQKNDL